MAKFHQINRIEWWADYDPLRGVMTNSSFTADTREGQWFGDRA